MLKKSILYFIISVFCWYSIALNILKDSNGLKSSSELKNFNANLAILNRSRFQSFLFKKKSLCNIIIVTSYPSVKSDSLFDIHIYKDFLLENKIFLSNCELKTIAIIENVEAKYNENQIFQFNIDKKQINNDINELIEIINHSKANYVLINQKSKVTSFWWNLAKMANKISKKIKLDFILNLLVVNEYSLKNIELVRKIGEIKTVNILVFSKTAYKRLLHAYGIEKEKIIFIPFKSNIYLENMKLFAEKYMMQILKKEALLFRNLTRIFENSYKSKTISLNNNNLKVFIRRNLPRNLSMFCLYVDFNVQINILIDKYFSIIRIGLVSDNFYVLIDRISGFDTFEMGKKKHLNFFSLDYIKKELVFESINIGLTIKNKNDELSIVFYKFNRFLLAFGIIGSVINHLGNDINFNNKILHQNGKYFSMWKINNNDIFSHFSKQQCDKYLEEDLNIYISTERAKQKNKFDFIIEGQVFSRNSLAVANRNMYLALLKTNEIRVILDPTDYLRKKENDFETLLVYSFYHRNQIKNHRIDYSYKKLFILKHNWPMIMDLNTKKYDLYKKKVIFIHQQPWEFHSLPLKWIPYLKNTKIKELWVPSEYNRQAFQANDLPSERIKVVPYGISLEKFKISPQNLNLDTQKKFRFLTIGGMVARKGIDLILDAYSSLFSSTDKVSLRIHSIYGDDFALRKFLKIKQNKNSPEIIFTKNVLTTIEKITLFKSANVYLSPYRSEGFGLTILEAMAAGLPPIVSNYGPAKEFCSNKCCSFIEAEEKDCLIYPCGKKSIFGYKTLYQPKWSEPNVQLLKSKMLELYKNPSSLQNKSLECLQDASNYSLEKLSDRVLKRIKLLNNSKLQNQLP